MATPTPELHGILERRQAAIEAGGFVDPRSQPAPLVPKHEIIADKLAKAKVAPPIPAISKFPTVRSVGAAKHRTNSHIDCSLTVEWSSPVPAASSSVTPPSASPVHVLILKLEHYAHGIFSSFASWLPVVPTEVKNTLVPSPPLASNKKPHFPKPASAYAYTLDDIDIEAYGLKGAEYVVVKTWEAHAGEVTAGQTDIAFMHKGLTAGTTYGYQITPGILTITGAPQLKGVPAVQAAITSSMDWSPTPLALTAATATDEEEAARLAKIAEEAKAAAAADEAARKKTEAAKRQLLAESGDFSKDVFARRLDSFKEAETKVPSSRSSPAAAPPLAATHEKVFVNSSVLLEKDAEAARLRAEAAAAQAHVAALLQRQEENERKLEAAAAAHAEATRRAEELAAQLAAEAAHKQEAAFLAAVAAPEGVSDGVDSSPLLSPPLPSTLPTSQPAATAEAEAQVPATPEPNQPAAPVSSGGILSYLGW